MRNTFIHIEGGGPVDERIVQSMPHGMFRQCLWGDYANEHRSAEASVTAAELPVALAAAGPPSIAIAQEGSQFISPGTIVVIEGLAKCPAFNGQSGVVQSWDEETQRYSILLASAGCGRQWAKVKGVNLRLAFPPQVSCFAPASGFQGYVAPLVSEMPDMPPSPCGIWEGTRLAAPPLKLTALV